MSRELRTYSLHKYILMRHGGKTADWILKSVTFEHAQPFSAGHVRVHTSSNTKACDRELRAARISVYFFPSRTSTGRKECGLGKGRYG